jgi:hypothetical protein
MTTSFHRHCRLLVATACLCVAVSPIPARAEETSALNKIVELNKKALRTYEELDMETAVKLLKQAIELCNLEGLDRHRAAARSHIHLGVVYVSGLKLREQGLAEFRRALGIDPVIRVTKSVSNPEVEAVFAEALAKGGDAPPPSLVAPAPSSPQPARLPMALPTSGVAKESAIGHPPVTEAIAGKAVEIKAQIPRSLRAEKIVLAYRVGGEGEFLAREMRPIENAPDWYHEKIPADATQAGQVSNYVSYYIEAQDDDGQPLMASGTQVAPHQIRIVSEESESADGIAAGKAGSDKTVASTPLWFVLAAGAGGGYFSGSPEMNSTNDAGKSLKSSGTELAALGHLAPELGYFHSEHFLFSVQGRFQFVTGGQDVTYGGKTYKASKTALAGLAKASYFLREPSEHFQPFVALQAGLGEIRYPVTTSPLQGCGANGGTGTCKDTVRGGLGLFGAAAGFAYMLSDNMGLYAALSSLIGAPNLAVDCDVNLGVTLVR